MKRFSCIKHVSSKCNHKCLWKSEVEIDLTQTEEEKVL